MDDMATENKRRAAVLWWEVIASVCRSPDKWSLSMMIDEFQNVCSYLLLRTRTYLCLSPSTTHSGSRTDSWWAKTSLDDANFGFYILH